MWGNSKHKEKKLLKIKLKIGIQSDNNANIQNNQAKVEVNYLEEAIHKNTNVLNKQKLIYLKFI
jgi:hypothetical protein